MRPGALIGVDFNNKAITGSELYVFNFAHESLTVKEAWPETKRRRLHSYRAEIPDFYLEEQELDEYTVVGRVVWIYTDTKQRLSYEEGYSMKFGDNRPVSIVPDTAPEDSRPRINHLTGLGFKEGLPIVIERQGGKLIFEGEFLMETRDTSGPIAIPKKEKVIEKKEVFLRDIQSIDITDESGRSLGKTALWGVVGALALGPLGLIGGAMLGGRKRWKSFLIFQVKPENGVPYPIIFGGANQKEIRQYYDNLITVLNQP